MNNDLYDLDLPCSSLLSFFSINMYRKILGLHVNILQLYKVQMKIHITLLHLNIPNMKILNLETFEKFQIWDFGDLELRLQVTQEVKHMQIFLNLLNSKTWNTSSHKHMVTIYNLYSILTQVMLFLFHGLIYATSTVTMKKLTDYENT